MTFLIILLLIALNGYFSLAEVALISVKEAELFREESKHNYRAFEVLKLIKNPAEFLSSIQVGITLLGILEGIYGGNLLAAQLDHLMVILGLSRWVSHNSTLVIAIALITYLSILFGELIPKSIALRMPLRVSLSIAPSLTLFSNLFYPFLKVLTFSTRIILSLFTIENMEEKTTEEDIKQILSKAYQQGVIGKQQYWMQENVLSFKYLTAGRIMKAARIIACIPVEWDNEQVRTFIKSRPYSYFPVYKGTKNNIVGMIDTKEFFINNLLTWQQGIFPGCRIPAEMPVRELFALFKEHKKDFGIVINKSNDFMGVVAMQDIMEGVFGDMPEQEDYSAYFYAISEKVWMAEDFIHLQRIRIQLSLPWIREFESKYMNLAEFMAGESNGRETLIKNGTAFEIMPRDKNGNSKIKITLP